MARRMRAGGLTAAALTAALVLCGGASALADTPTTSPSPSTSSATASPSSTATGSSAATGAAAQALAARIVALQRLAEKKGEVAQKAGEKANDARSAADAAQQALVQARAAAAAAAAHAAETRARASVVAAQLARTNVGTLPLSLLLNANSAEGVLGGLSTTGQLSVESQQLYAQAKADEAEAERLRSVADLEATHAATAARVAATAYAKAKKKAATAKTAVDAALAEQRTLLHSDADLSDVCASVGSAPVAECLPTSGAAPAGRSVGAKVVRYALAQIGKPYVFGAAGPAAYDCSGLTLAAYASAGVAIGTHSATNQYDVAQAEGDLVPIKDAKPGDLLFYTDGGGDMYHVTIYAGNGLMLEAPYPGSTVRGAPVRTGDLVSQAAHFG